MPDESASVAPDDLEVAPGFEKTHLQGSAFVPASDIELRDLLEKAFDYRGDVTLRLKDDSVLEGYIFDRFIGSTLQESKVRLVLQGSSQKISVTFDQVQGLKFSGRDTAVGKSFEAWVKKYWEKKSAGETNIELVPEKLD